MGEVNGMDRNDVIKVLSLLAEGTNPETGEVYDHGSPYQNPRIIRALFHAVRLLEGKENIQSAGDAPKKERKNFKVPSHEDSGWENPTDIMQCRNAEAKRSLRAYAPWTGKEDEDLRRIHREGMSVQKMAFYFSRELGAIRSRLEKLGLK